MTKDKPYFNENFFYGNQQNQFPKRQDKLRDEIKEEIEKQRSQVLTQAEYEKVQLQFKEKGVKRVPFFLADEKTMHTQFVLGTIQRVMTGVNLGYFGLSGYNLLFARLASPDLLYICTGGMTVMNVIFTYYFRKMRKTAIQRIEWDVETEQFVIVQPAGVQGEISRFLPVSELIMNAKSKERDCIYFEATSGIGLATVNKGRWYNLMLFMHLMQRRQEKPKIVQEMTEEEEKFFQ